MGSSSQPSRSLRRRHRRSSRTRCSQHIKFLASDDLKGRGNGTDGLERAGDYIAEQFKAAGLTPGGRDGDWFQPFELDAGLPIGRGQQLSIDPRRAQTVRLSLGRVYYPLAVAASDSDRMPSMDLDGRAARVRRLRPLGAVRSTTTTTRGLDVTGKAVLIFSHEPQENESDSRLNGTRPMPETTLDSKAQRRAQPRRARAARRLDPSHRTDEANYKLFASEPDAEDHGIPVLRVRRDEIGAAPRGVGSRSTAARRSTST